MIRQLLWKLFGLDIAKSALTDYDRVECPHCGQGLMKPKMEREGDE